MQINKRYAGSQQLKSKKSRKGFMSLTLLIDNICLLFVYTHT